MPKVYPASQHPRDLFQAKGLWEDESARGRRRFYYEVRETKEFTMAEIQEQLAVIYGLRPEDFGLIEIKKQSSGGFIENAELRLKPEISQQFFGHEVSFEFTAEGKIDVNIQSLVTNLHRNDFYSDGDVRGESLADYDRISGKWKIQPGILPIKKSRI